MSVNSSEPLQHGHVHHIVDATRSSKHLASDHVMNVALIPFLEKILSTHMLLQIGKGDEPEE